MGFRPRLLGALLLATATARSGAAIPPPCPGSANVTVFVENLSDAPAVTVDLEGTLAADATTCAGNGATAYQQTFVCTGRGVVRCGPISGLAPGTWVHRLKVTVPGSEEQRQAQREVLIGGTDASNVLVWTVYPKTFVVDTANADVFRAALTAAACYTERDPASPCYTGADRGPALVIFSAKAFPGSAAAVRLSLIPSCIIDETRNRCAPDAATAGLCFTGSHIVVDALDANGLPGGVVLAVGTCGRHLLRLYGSDNVLRGLAFEGSQKDKPSPPCQADAVYITGSAAKRNRIEQARIMGPSCGDALSAQDGAGDEDASADNLVVDSWISGAADKGVKVTTAAHATIQRSCISDNRNGGIQSTLGGHVRAIENVVQHNLPGNAENGISAGNVASNDPAARSTVVTDGNVVRFSGGDGLSLSDNGSATYRNDYVADNQFGGSKVETTAEGPPGAVPTARFHGVALVCNRHEHLTGTCNPSSGDVEEPCTTAADCCTRDDGSVDQACLAITSCSQSFPRGFGAVTAQAPGHEAPDASYGDATDPGRNAFSSNENAPAGANFTVRGLSTAVPAQGNQWEHCGSDAACDVSEVATNDVDGPTDLGTPDGPRAGAPVLLRTSPPRPRAGEIVRVFGENFDAIGGNPLFVGGMPDCADLTTCSAANPCPTGPCVNGICPCAPDNPTVRSANVQTGANRIRLLSTNGAQVGDTLYPDAVTPTMLVFRMPFDCFAPLVLEVAKRDPSGIRQTTRLVRALCDPDGCAEQPAGAPCDDRDACTLGDRCDGAGHCVADHPLVCDSPCLACDRTQGCIPKPAAIACDDGNACTAHDHCSGTGNTCVSGPPLACNGPCLSGRCDTTRGCLPAPAGTLCRPPADACDVAESCDGSRTTCPADAFVPAGSVCRVARDPCALPDTCTGTGPVCLAANLVKTAFEAVSCAFERNPSPSACTGEPVPPAVAHLFVRAGNAVTRAAEARPAKRRRLLANARASIRKAIKLTNHAARRPANPISAACADALRPLLADALDRLRTPA